MRRETSTMIALVGAVSGDLLARLAESPNVAVVRPPAATVTSESAQRGSAGSARPGRSAAREPDPPHPGWEPGALAMQEAARRRATYVVVSADPLAGVAAAWRSMWALTAGPAGTAGFEEAAADALGAWRAKRFELPDYYLMITPAEDTLTGPDLYLGPLHAARPHRVAVGTAGAPADGSASGSPAGAGSLLDTLRSLPHGPWWAPLDELLDDIRRFYAGSLAEAAQTPV